MRLRAREKGKIVMMGKITSTAIALAALATPALAQNTCGDSPKAPDVPDGKTASAQEVNAATQQVIAFIKTSDQWQKCMKDYLDAQKAAAKAAKQDFDPKVEQTIMDAGAANQKEKVRVGTAMNAALAAYHKAHPN
jgi:hypothetical protein